MQAKLSSLVATVLVAAGCLSACTRESPDKLIASGKRYLEQGNPKAAAIEFKNAMQVSAESGEVRFLLGKALLESEEYPTAVVELEKARKAQYAEDEVLPLLAKALVLRGDARRVTEEFASRTLTQPASQAELNAWVASAYLARAMREEARKTLEAALAVAPDQPTALLLDGRMKAVEGDGDAAIAAVERVLAKTPGPEAWLLDGDLLQRYKRDLPGAIAAYKKGLESRKDHVGLNTALLGAYLLAKDEKAARAQLEAFRSSRPGHPMVTLFDAQFAYQDGDYKKAGDLAQPLLKTAPGHPLVLQLAGALAFNAGDLQQAEQHFVKALQASPGLMLSRRLLIETYSRLGEQDKALAVMRPLLALKDPDAQMLSLIASVYLQNGRPKEAEEFLTRAVQKNPDDAKRRTALAVTHLMLDPKNGGAIEELRSIASADDKDISADLTLIGAFARREDVPATLAAIEALEKKQPKNPVGPTLRGRLQASKGDFAAARKSFERALALDPTFFEAVDALAALDVREKNPSAAQQRMQAYLQAKPDDARPLMALARLAAATGAPKEEVAGLLARAIKAKPLDAPPRQMLASYYLERREIKLALQTAQEGVAALPNNGSMLAILGRCEMAAGDYNQAASTFGKLAAVQPNSHLPLMGLGQAYYAGGNKREALKAFRHAMDVAPQNLVAKRAAMALELEEGRKDAAVEIARVTQKASPDRASGWVLEGDLEASQRNWEPAAAAYREALKKQPLAEVVAKLHQTLRMAGKTGDANALAAKWTKDHPSDPALPAYLAQVALGDKNYPGAEPLLQQVAKARPNDAAVLNNLAWTLAKQGKSGALEYAQRANELMPNQPSLMDTLAMILAQSNQLPQALELQKKAVALQPDNNSLKVSLAKLYLASGDKAQARKELDELAKVEGEFAGQEDLRELRSRL